MVSMAIAPTVTQLWVYGDAFQERERQKVNFNFWSDLHLIGSQAVIKIYVIIKIYWPRSMCSQFNSIWILLLCVVLSHNHHKLSIRCPELQKRLLLLLLLCCVHRFSSCSSESNRSLPKCFFFASSISNSFYDFIRIYTVFIFGMR